MQMNMLAESQVEQSQLTEKEVQSFYNLRKDQYRQAPQISFRQVYFKDRNPGPTGRLQNYSNSWIGSTKMRMTTGNTAMPLCCSLPTRYKPPTRSATSSGMEFSQQQLFELEGSLPGLGPINLGIWQPSGSNPEEKTEEEDAPLEQVWDEVVNELIYEEKQAAKEQFYTELLRQYDVSYQGLAKQLVQNN